MVKMVHGELIDLRRSVLALRDDAVLFCRGTDQEDVSAPLEETPRGGAGRVVAAARQEVKQETDLQVVAEHVAVVLETSRWGRAHHRIEMVFLGAERARRTVPVQREENPDPSFALLANANTFRLRPPSAGCPCFLSRSRRAAAHLGNLQCREVHEINSNVEGW